MRRGIIGAPRRGTGETLEGQRSEGVLIGRRESLAAALFLWSDPRGARGWCAPRQRNGRRRRPSETDVDQTHPPVLVDEHVGRVQGAVHKCASMEILECPSHLREEPAGGAQIHRAVLEEPFGQ